MEIKYATVSAPKCRETSTGSRQSSLKPVPKAATGTTFQSELNEFQIKLRASGLTLVGFAKVSGTPMSTVKSRLRTDHIVPTIESEFFCKMAGNQNKTLKTSTNTINKIMENLFYALRIQTKNAQKKNM